jgi:hypothetical protein
MKCPRCWMLNGATETTCAKCGGPLRLPAVTPQWAYFFAVICGIIPVLTLGGLLPMAVACSGVSGCLGVARTRSVPLVLRFFACVAICLVCWGVAAVILWPLIQKKLR